MDAQSPQVKAALGFYDAAASYDIESLSAILAPTYTHSFLPDSLSRAMNWPAVFSREDVLSMTESVLWKLFKGLKIVPTDIVAAGDTVVVHAKSADGVKGAFTGTPYTQEYVNIFTLSAQEDGTYKVANIKEMLDSKYTIEWFTKETAAAQAASK